MLYKITWWWVNAMDSPEIIELSADTFNGIKDVATAISKCRYISRVTVMDQYNHLLIVIHNPT
jgi:putative protein kinase ArgK-like GTPase of G3E family